MAAETSPFLEPGSRTRADSLAIILLARDSLLPVYPQQFAGEHDGYAEGAVLNTRYGSFPHSTLIDIPFGSQVRASAVDTGSRGRKRKRNAQAAAEGTAAADTPNEDSQTGGEGGSGVKAAAAAAAAVPTSSSGFVHILAPTPELWTMSLPHRTQVVYTPDYSFILQRLRARPGTRIIEAGAGSGSFTHASVRAVYNGYPTTKAAVAAEEQTGESKKKTSSKRGKVFSFEFNEKRYETMAVELEKHKLQGLVQLTHRDVYSDGFLVDGKSPEAEAVFLDLPAPWQALEHLTRQRYQRQDDSETAPDTETSSREEWVSPLNPNKSVYICSFSPCVEQVTRTVSAMRRLGWVDIDVVEIANKRLFVTRERISLRHPNEKRGIQHAPHDVGEAVDRLRRIQQNYERKTRENTSVDESGMDLDEDEAASSRGKGENGAVGDTYAGYTDEKPWLDGQLVTRTETDIKSHTSYLVFAVLPREWTAADEAEALRRWPCGKEEGVIGTLSRKARKEEKRRLHFEGSGKKNKAAPAPPAASAVAPVEAEQQQQEQQQQQQQQQNEPSGTENMVTDV